MSSEYCYIYVNAKYTVYILCFLFLIVTKHTHHQYIDWSIIRHDKSDVLIIVDRNRLQGYEFWFWFWDLICKVTFDLGIEIWFVSYNSHKFGFGSEIRFWSWDLILELRFDLEAEIHTSFDIWFGVRILFKGCRSRGFWFWFWNSKIQSHQKHPW